MTLRPQTEGRCFVSLEFEAVSYDYNGEIALDDISFAARPGQITCLLGPSGCGKSTLLRLAAGIIPLQKGEIRLDGDRLAGPDNSPPPEARPVGLVFQEGALFPHLTVARNVEFGLADRSNKRQIAADLLDQVGLSSLARRYPHTLSGGQQQRVAFARALAPAPRVLLLDEPFANVDVVRRRSLREDMRRTLKDRGAIVIFVTHNPEEAVDISDQIIVMEARRILQKGTPEALYDNPVSARVGAFLSDSQIIRGARRQESIETAFGTWPLTAIRRGAALPTSTVDLLIRPGSIEISLGAHDTIIDDVRRIGSAQRISVRARSGDRLHLEADRDASFPLGAAVKITPKPAAILAFAATSLESP
ncbi:MAG: ABC transporter ATP-binding protein [Pseudomonadota bacterium]